MIPTSPSPSDAAFSTGTARVEQSSCHSCRADPSVRGCVAVIWYAVQTYYGASLLDQYVQHVGKKEARRPAHTRRRGFRAIFGNGYYNIPNTLPKSAQTTSRFMFIYFLFWLIQCPFVLIHPSAARHIFTVKSFM